MSLQCGIIGIANVGKALFLIVWLQIKQRQAISHIATKPI